VNNLKYCFVCVSLGLATMATAQTATSSASNSATGPITMQGCINGGARGYTFIQTSTGTTFTLPAQDDRFAQYRGKMVNITGLETPPPASAGSKDLPKFTPDTVKQIGDCPLNATGNPDRPYGAPMTTPPTSTNVPRRPNAPEASTPEYAPPGAPSQTPPTVGNNPNQTGATGAPSPGTGNPPAPPKPPMS
jgi:hypothetical protein